MVWTDKSVSAAIGVPLIDKRGAMRKPHLVYQEAGQIHDGTRRGFVAGGPVNPLQSFHNDSDTERLTAILHSRPPPGYRMLPGPLFLLYFSVRIGGEPINVSGYLFDTLNNPLIRDGLTASHKRNNRPTKLPFAT